MNPILKNRKILLEKHPFLDESDVRRLVNLLGKTSTILGPITMPKEEDLDKYKSPHGMINHYLKNLIDKSEDEIKELQNLPESVRGKDLIKYLKTDAELKTTEEWIEEMEGKDEN